MLAAASTVAREGSSPAATSALRALRATIEDAVEVLDERDVEVARARVAFAAAGGGKLALRENGSGGDDLAAAAPPPLPPPSTTVAPESGDGGANFGGGGDEEEDDESGGGVLFLSAPPPPKAAVPRPSNGSGDALSKHIDAGRRASSDEAARNGMSVSPTKNGYTGGGIIGGPPKAVTQVVSFADGVAAS